MRTLAIIIFVIFLVIALPISFFLDMKKRREEKENYGEPVDPQDCLQGFSTTHPEDTSYIGDMPQTKFYRNVANVERRRMEKAAKEAAKKKH